MEHGKRQQPPEHSGSQRPRARQRGSAVGRFFGVLGTLVLIGICTAAMLVFIFMTYVKTTLAPTLQVNADDYTMKQSSIILYQDQETEEWVEYQTVHGVENRIWVDYDQMPEALSWAAVSIEDQRFYTHHGVDWKRTLGAVLQFTNDSGYGGSTITQQMLKNMTKDNKPYVNRKVREIFRALEFEKNYSKDQILELYLNMIALGQGCYGVETAAEFYFGKDVSELSVAECASLIAITNNPSMYGPMSTVVMTNPETGVKKTARQLNKQRQELILDKMAEVINPDTGKPFLTQEEADAAKAEVLHFSDGSTSAEDIVAQANGGVQANDWFVERVLEEVAVDLSEELDIDKEAAYTRIYNSGYRIYTTLDPKIQQIAESVYEDRSNLDVTSRKGQAIQSGITIVDPTTGYVVAQVGAIGEKTGNRVTDFATMRRQPGSSIKPLTVYSPAIDAGAVTPGTAFDDYPVRLLNNNPWPKNSPNKFRGFTMVQDGLRLSINTIAVQVLEKLGAENSFAFATDNLNLNLVADDMNTAALGLGGLTYGLSTEEMAAAYATFANNGVYNEPRTYIRVTKAESNGDETVVLENEGESHVAMKDTTAYLMNQMLQTVVSSGTGTAARFGGMSIAGKTGTTSDNYDRYFVGYTPYYVAAVWTGYQFNEKVVYSGNPAITMWKKVMQQIHEELPNKSFDKPSSGLETVTICRDSGLKCSDACHADSRGDRGVTITVAAGTAPTESCTLHAYRDYCTEGKCLATEFCPAESVTQAAFLDYTRENYGANIKAEDDAYLISSMEKAIGLTPTVSADGTEVYPAVIGCPVHTTSAEAPDGPITDPEDPDYDPSLDPNSPDYVPPADDGGGGEGTVPPSEPEEPGVPADPGTEGSGDWWNGLWNE